MQLAHGKFMPVCTPASFRRNNHPTSSHSVDPIASAQRNSKCRHGTTDVFDSRVGWPEPGNVRAASYDAETSMQPVRHHIRTPFAGFGKRSPKVETGQESDSRRGGRDPVPGLGRCEMGRYVGSPLSDTLRMWTWFVSFFSFLAFLVCFLPSCFSH